MTKDEEIKKLKEELEYHKKNSVMICGLSSDDDHDDEPAKELGVKDLPYKDEVESILGRKFNKGGLAGDIMYTGDEDYKVTSSYGEDEMQMNKGGTVDGQMQMAFMDEGGIADDGMDVDPVSGNEVPPGSLAEEVRDDIPAQLSEG